jgi:regulator of RNase E activity RraA
MKKNRIVLTKAELEPFRHLDACLLANAIETFHARLRNEGFIDSSVHCLFPRLSPMVGYAATIKVRGSDPPTAGGLYPDRNGWWDHILSMPAPRVVVVQDSARRPGLGSLLGVVHVNILRAIGCVGAVTNGEVRDIPSAEALHFPFFSGDISVSHAYVHIVEIGGLEIQRGDLLHGDVHSVQTAYSNRSWTWKRNLAADSLAVSTGAVSAAPTAAVSTPTAAKPASATAAKPTPTKTAAKSTSAKTAITAQSPTVTTANHETRSVVWISIIIIRVSAVVGIN